MVADRVGDVKEEIFRLFPKWEEDGSQLVLLSCRLSLSRFGRIIEWRTAPPSREKREKGRHEADGPKGGQPAEVPH